MNENIKFEYYIFIKKIKEKIYIKNQIKENIILFQKRSALDQLLMNVIFKMKNDILKERLKNLLIKKFIYRLMNQYIESYNKGNSDNIEKNNKDKYGLLESQKRIFNNFIFKSYVFSFFKRVKICLNNSKIKNTQNNIIIKKRNDFLKNCFLQIKEYKSYSFQNVKKMLFKKIFFSKIKYLMVNKANDINNINKLTNVKKLFIFKVNYKLFINNLKSFKASNNTIKAIKQKLEKYKENNQKTLETKKYFKIFINKVKINKKENDYLKRKIFNIIKKNVIISKELKHYLNEAEEIN
jgi:hypothetical protein